MNLEERLKIVNEMQAINEKQISNREKALELSRKLAEDDLNRELKLEIKKLELENATLFNRSKELTRKL